MAKKKKNVKEEVERITLSSGAILVKYDDGSMDIITPLSAEDIEEITGSGSSEDQDDDSDDDQDDNDDSDDSDEEEEELTGERLMEMDFEDLEDLCDDKELDTDPDDYDEDDIDKLRKAIAKELGISLPKAKDSKKKGKKGKK